MKESSVNQRSMDVMRVIKILRDELDGVEGTMTLFLIKQFGKDPFIILISCLLSLRSRDTVTYPVCLELFKHVRTPHELVAFDRKKLEKIIYPIGFYKKKAETIQKVSHELIERFDGIVPNTLEQLLALPGVGRKTANLVLGAAYDIPAICVDVHVHRISNQLGVVNTKTPEETEYALMEKLPREYWIEWNQLLVVCGQRGLLSIILKKLALEQ